MAYRTLIISFLFSLMLFVVLYLKYKNKQKAGLVCTLILFGLFTYGSIYDKLETLFFNGLWPFSNIHRYLILFYVFLIFTIFVVIFKRNKKLIKVNYFLNVLIIVIIFLNIFNIARYTYSNPKAAENPYLESIKLENNLAVKDSIFTPDIYYIILDGYANTEILKKYYNYDNSLFINFLKDHGFYIAEKSRTNYAYTFFSLSSSLNCSYLQGPINKTIGSLNTNSLISKNFIFSFLKKHNYKIVNLKSGYAITGKLEFSDISIPIGGLNEFERSILQLTILRLDDLFGFFSYFRLKSQFLLLNSVIEKPSPKFSLIHIVSPHPPFVFTKDGELKTKSSFTSNSWEPRKDYVGQLEYTSEIIKNFINNIINKSTKKPIIILQSDHGPWISESSEENIYDARTYILNAYLVPENCKQNLYPTISPVNSFRVVFNNLFDLKFKLLPDLPPNKIKLLGDPIFINKIRNN